MQPTRPSRCADESGIFLRHGALMRNVILAGWTAAVRPCAGVSGRRTLDDPFLSFTNMHAEWQVINGDDDNDYELASRDTFCPAERSFEAYLFGLTEGRGPCCAPI